MTVIGKMLVFLVLVLSLVWNGLVVNSYVTRQNWKAEVKKYQDRAVEAADAANALRKLVDAERDASEDAKRVLREEIARLYAQKATLETQKAELIKATEDRLAAEKQRGADDTKLQTNNKSLLEQVDNLTKTLSANQKVINDMTLETEKAKADKTRAELEASTQLLRAEKLAEQLLELNERLNEMRNGPRGAVAGRTSAPAGFRGTVRSRSGDLVSFTPGLDAGLQKGAVLTVFRTVPAPKYLGKITVIQVDPKEAVGRFTPPPGGRLGPDDYPKADDELKE